MLAVQPSPKATPTYYICGSGSDVFLQLLIIDVICECNDMKHKYKYEPAIDEPDIYFTYIHFCLYVLPYSKVIRTTILVRLGDALA